MGLSGSSLALLLGAGGTFASAGSQYVAGQRAKTAADSQAALSDFNAHIADTQAQDAIDRGQIEENTFRAHVRATVGEQRAALGAAGLDLGVGSAADVQASTAQTGEMDALQIRTNALREAWGFQVEATDLRQRAQIQRQTGEQEASAGKWAAATTLLGGGASLLGARYGVGTKPKTTSVPLNAKLAPRIGRL